MRDDSSEWPSKMILCSFTERLDSSRTSKFFQMIRNLSAAQ